MKTVSASLLLALVPLAAATGGVRPPAASCATDYTPFVSRGCYDDASDKTLVYRSLSDQTKMTIEKCTAECKGNGFRYAGLKYYGICYCGSDLEAQSLDASQCNLACSDNKDQICGGENNLSVYEDPTFVKGPADVTSDDYEPLGCYSDEATAGRALNYKVDIPADSFDTNACINACREGGFPYAGTEFGGECWCDATLGSTNVLADDGSCDMPCSGDDSMTCGGAGHINVYLAKDLQSPQPCGYKPSTTTTTKAACTTTTAANTGAVGTTTNAAGATTTTNAVATTTTTNAGPAVPTCTSTQVVPPACEFKAGNWCAPPLPEWTNKDGCLLAGKTCALQLASCFKNAGWPGVQLCFEFGAWCAQVKSFASCSDCAVASPSKCHKRAAWNKYKPANVVIPTTTTVTGPCPTSLVASTTTRAAATTTACPPEPTNICTQPTNDRWGYSADRPVAGIAMPVVSCNDVKEDFTRNPFKLYTHADSRRCPSFSWNSRPNVCAEACEEQYNECKETYVRGCDKKRDVDAELERRSPNPWFFGSWSTSSYSNSNSNTNNDGCAGSDSKSEWCKKGSDVLKCWGKGPNNVNTSGLRCKAQYVDCLAANKRVNPGQSCKAFCR